MLLHPGVSPIGGHRTGRPLLGGQLTCQLFSAVAKIHMGFLQMKFSILDK